MFIYKTTNMVNGKIYVGKCQKNKDDKYLGSGQIVKKAIKKYGKENFTREIIEDGITDKNYLCEREKYWIKFYDSRNPEIGYNISAGGDGNSSPMSEEQKKKLSDINNQEEIRQKKSEANTGEKNPNFGKKTSDETKQKMSKAAKGKIFSDETRKKLSESAKGKVLSDETKRKIGEALIGRFSGENSPMWGKPKSDETKRKISESQKGVNNVASKPVLQFAKDGEFIARYAGTREAERETGIDSSGISACARGNLKSSGGFVWHYN